MTTAADDLLSVENVAERFGCSVATVRYRVAKAGLVPTHTVRSPRGVPLLHLFAPDEVDAYFEAHPIPVDARRGAA